MIHVVGERGTTVALYDDAPPLDTEAAAGRSPLSISRDIGHILLGDVDSAALDALTIPYSFLGDGELPPGLTKEQVAAIQEARLALNVVWRADLEANDIDPSEVTILRENSFIGVYDSIHDRLEWHKERPHPEVPFLLYGVSLGQVPGTLCAHGPHELAPTTRYRTLNNQQDAEGANFTLVSYPPAQIFQMYPHTIHTTPKEGGPRLLLLQPLTLAQV
ncbi:MAG TPA: hypothetical protein VKQ34_02835 [Candidatus Saccharimonadales bacterium]|nr:hypothetical protein [Candidatus Saccharimonadales bacterium]